MEVQMNVAGRDGAKLGFSSETVTATKGNVMVFGGHSGQGMLYAKELANARTTSSITTVSKAGRPRAPGPAQAFMQAMSQECTHYMAACDVTDAKAVECLTDWAPPASVEEQWPMELEEGSWDPMVAQIKQDMGSMGILQLKNALRSLEDAKLQLIYQRREVKSQLQHKAYAGDKEMLQEQEISLQEREAAVMELIADLTTKLGAIAE